MPGTEDAVDSDPRRLHPDLPGRKAKGANGSRYTSVALPLDMWGRLSSLDDCGSPSRHRGPPPKQKSGGRPFCDTGLDRFWSHAVVMLLLTLCGSPYASRISLPTSCVRHSAVATPTSALEGAANFQPKERPQSARRRSALAWDRA